MFRRRIQPNLKDRRRVRPQFKNPQSTTNIGNGLQVRRLSLRVTWVSVGACMFFFWAARAHRFQRDNGRSGTTQDCPNTTCGFWFLKQFLFRAAMHVKKTASRRGACGLRSMHPCSYIFSSQLSFAIEQLCNIHKTRSAPPRRFCIKQNNQISLALLKTSSKFSKYCAC